MLNGAFKAPFFIELNYPLSPIHISLLSNHLFCRIELHKICASLR